MSAPAEEPAIPSRLRRPLAAVWISLGLHAAVIALVQVAPPAPVRMGEPAIEARLVPAHAATQTAAKAPLKDGVAKRIPELVPSVTAEALPLLPPEPAPVPRDPPGSSAPPAAVVQPAAAAAAGQAGVSMPAVAAPTAAITSAVDLTYYSVRELDVQPRALREIIPDYPADADRQRLSGKVRVLLKLEADGRVSDVGIVSAMPPGVFEEATLEAFQNVRFAPAQKNGLPVRARVLIEVVYDWEGRSRKP